MTSREIVRKSLYFQSPPRMPYWFPEPYGADIFFTGLSPSTDARCANGIDEWGCVWESLSEAMGEVKDSPLKNWDDFDKLRVPDAMEDSRYANVRTARGEHKDKYIIMSIPSIYERALFIRGFENAQADILEYPEYMAALVNLLTDINISIIRRCKDYDVDAIIQWDDWGLQDRLMINPVKWREIWKPAYKRLYTEVCNVGMDVFLHSCGYIGLLRRRVWL